jgi:DNA-binding response OmpR family regulator
MDGNDVAVVYLPRERDRLEALRRSGGARVVVVDEGPPPMDGDCLEEWLRTPVDVDELKARVATVWSRAQRHGVVPTVDADGVLRYRGKIVMLAPLQRRLVEPLIERLGAVVGRETLLRRAWPTGAPEKRNVLDVHVARLRKQFADVGLELKTVRRRGYLLSPSESGPHDY